MSVIALKYNMRVRALKYDMRVRALKYNMRAKALNYNVIDNKQNIGKQAYNGEFHLTSRL